MNPFHLAGIDLIQETDTVIGQETAKTIAHTIQDTITEPTHDLNPVHVSEDTQGHRLDIVLVTITIHHKGQATEIDTIPEKEAQKTDILATEEDPTHPTGNDLEAEPQEEGTKKGTTIDSPAI